MHFAALDTSRMPASVVLFVVMTLLFVPYRAAAQRLRPSRELNNVHGIGVAASPGELRPELLLAEDPFDDDEQEDDGDDLFSFMTVGTELRLRARAVPAGDNDVGGDGLGANGGFRVESAASLSGAVNAGAGLDADAEAAAAAGWEVLFAEGLRRSERAVAAEASAVQSWAVDAGGGSVPRAMKQAEEIMQRAFDQAPAQHDGGPQQFRRKLAERALRMYHHAKWLAESNLARAAELRYRKAAALALQCRRTVLAATSLARLGYFLVQWGRDDDARAVLLEALGINTRASGGGLAAYLYGVLERRQAGPDVRRLHQAEDLILNAGEQPSVELEASRIEMVQDIEYWRQAEQSPTNCLRTPDVATLLICLCSHCGAAIWRSTAAWWGDGDVSHAGAVECTTSDVCGAKGDADNSATSVVAANADVEAEAADAAAIGRSEGRKIVGGALALATR